MKVLRTRRPVSVSSRMPLYRRTAAYMDVFLPSAFLWSRAPTSEFGRRHSAPRRRTGRSHCGPGSVTAGLVECLSLPPVRTPALTRSEVAQTAGCVTSAIYSTTAFATPISSAVVIDSR